MMLSLFRVFVPSWRFFDEAKPIPSLELRLAPEGNAWGAWLPVFDRLPDRSPWQLCFNPLENDRLARQSLLSRFLNEASDWKPGDQAVTGSVSYELVRGLVLERVARESRKGKVRFQFRLMLEGEEALLSPEEGCVI